MLDAGIPYPKGNRVIVFSGFILDKVQSNSSPTWDISATVPCLEIDTIPIFHFHITRQNRSLPTERSLTTGRFSWYHALVMKYGLGCPMPEGFDRLLKVSYFEWFSQESVRSTRKNSSVFIEFVSFPAVLLYVAG